MTRAEAIYRQSANRVVETAINARSEGREAYSTYVSGYDLAKHYRNEVVPIRKTHSDELLLRHIGVRGG